MVACHPRFARITRVSRFLNLCLHERRLAQVGVIIFCFDRISTRLSCLHLSWACHLMRQQGGCWYGSFAWPGGKLVPIAKLDHLACCWGLCFQAWKNSSASLLAIAGQLADLQSTGEEPLCHSGVIWARRQQIPTAVTAACQALQYLLRQPPVEQSRPHKLFGIVFSGSERPDRAGVCLSYSIRCIVDRTHSTVRVKRPDFRWFCAWRFCCHEDLRVEAAISLVDDATNKSAFPEQPSLPFWRCVRD